MLFSDTSREVCSWFVWPVLIYFAAQGQNAVWNDEVTEPGEGSSECDQSSVTSEL
jgi:hypothetical protein